jgi:DNA-binding GntR family transcriptional regulator
VDTTVKLDPAGKQPLYQQLADHLREQILAKALPPGQRLPSEGELAEQYDVARNTVRLGLGLLRAEGLIYTGRGRGTFVAEDPTAAPLRQMASKTHARSRREDTTQDTFVTDLAEMGRAGRMEIRVEAIAPPDEIASRLGLGDDDGAICRRRVQYVDERPSALADTWYPERIVAGSEIVEPKDVPRGTNRVLAELGHEVVRRTDEISARMPTPVEAQALQIAGGVPVMTALRTGFDAEDQPVAVYVSILPTDRHVVVYDVRCDV